MSKNTKTYVLLVLVVGIWGTIAYTIFSGLSPDHDVNSTNTVSPSFKIETFKVKEKFKIVANYRDPFLGKLPIVKKNNVVREQKKTTPEPNIVYTGFVESSSQKQRMFFVSINGTQHLLKIKASIGDVTLLSGTSKEIKVKYGNTIKKVTLN
ncbi:MAG: hypothetical protein ACSHW4_15855 [Cellulophaga sp.]